MPQSENPIMDLKFKFLLLPAMTISTREEKMCVLGGGRGADIVVLEFKQ